MYAIHCYYLYLKKDNCLRHAHSNNLGATFFFLAHRPFQLRSQALGGLRHMAGAKVQ